ncbi:MAG: nuclear transport factor 2 family protein [Betaproteobacteria bacterium]|nr:MAG: nuclear transport factor 2 family protein [Betaproteobacteria bacterium]
MTASEFLIAYEHALGVHTWEAVAPFIADDACFVFSDGTYLGKPNIEAAIRKTFAMILDETYRIDNVRWIFERADCALCTYQFAWSGKIGGVQQSGGGRGTNLLVKSGERWLVQHEHLGPLAR